MKTLPVTNNTVKLPAGKYVISDACYVLDNKASQLRRDLEFYAKSLGAPSWEKLDFDKLSSQSHGTVEFADGSVGVYLPTAYGDGSWDIHVWGRGTGRVSHNVCADAGNVSIIPLSQINADISDLEYIVEFELFEDGTVTIFDKGHWLIKDGTHIVTELNTDDEEEDDYDDEDEDDYWSFEDDDDADF